LRVVRFDARRATAAGFASSGDPKALIPAAPETLFFVLYALFAARRIRRV
jgi:hypothetical protein